MSVQHVGPLISSKLDNSMQEMIAARLDEEYCMPSSGRSYFLSSYEESVKRSKRMAIGLERPMPKSTVYALSLDMTPELTVAHLDRKFNDEFPTLRHNQ